MLGNTMLTAVPLSYATRPVYTLTVRVTDNGSPTMFTDQTVTVTLASPSVASRGTSQALASAPASALAAAQLQAYPNPFTDRVVLELELPRAEAYTLAVYDTKGRLLEKLPAGTSSADQRLQVEWQAGKYPAGLYVMKLTTATSVKQIRLLKN
jgi:hypothetical protein